MLLLSQPNERSQKYKEELFGHSVIVEAPETYAELQMMENLAILPLIDQWEKVDVHNRAKVIAYYQLRNMAEALRRHDDKQRENEAKLTKGKS